MSHSPELRILVLASLAVGVVTIIAMLSVHYA